MSEVHIQIAPEKLFDFFGIPITNTLFTGVIVVFLLILLSFIFKKKIKEIPGYLQGILEILIEKILDFLEGIFGSRQKAEKYFPFIASIFLFILLCNWFGILPGIGSIGFFEEHGDKKIFVPFFRSAASDLNFTLALAIIAILFINIAGVLAIGFFKHIEKFFSFKNPLNFFIGILEFVSEFSKIVSLAFRLFGNIFAGEVLLVIIAFLAPALIPIPFLFLEIIVGFMQALVFSMLTAVFTSMAVNYQH